MPSTDSSFVSAVPAAPADAAAAYFERLLALETDCADVYHALQHGPQDFVLLDVRGPDAYRRGHVPGAVNLPHADISNDALAEYADATLFVVYCAGPHCNGADRAALRLAKLGRPVKKMLGGITGWQDEGFTLKTG